MVNYLHFGTSWKGDIDSDAAQRMNVAKVFRMLARRWVLVAVTTAAVAIPATILAYQLKDYYVAGTQILIDPEGSKFVDGDINSGQKSVDAHALNQQFILTSAKVLMPVVQSEGLADDPEFGAAGASDARPEMRAQRALDALQKAIVATLNKSSFVINLSVTSGDPVKAARIANAIANTYIKTRLSMNNGVVRQATSDLSAQLANLEQKVQQGDRAVQAYKAANNLIDVDGRPTVERQIQEANSEISKISGNIAENDSIVAELAHARSDKDYFRSMLDSYLTPTIVTLRQRYHDAVEQQSALESSLGSRHPLLVTAKAKTQSALLLLDDQLANLSVSLTRNVERLKNQRALLQQNLSKLQEGLNRNDSSMVQLRELERQLASDRLVYENFLLRTRQLSGQEQTKTENPQILSVAQAPLDKAGPKRTMIIAGAALLGLLIGSGLALGREYADEKSATTVPADPERYIDRRREDDRDVDAHSEDGRDDALPHGHRSYASWANELLREARGTENYCVVIYASHEIDEPHRSIFGLARAAARTGKDILLVDAAPNAALTAETATEACAGLRNSILLRKLESDFIEVPGEPHLHIMPAGYKLPLLSIRSGGQPGHLVSWLNAGGMHFDLIIVDGGYTDAEPPIPEIELAANKFSILG